MKLCWLIPWKIIQEEQFNKKINKEYEFQNSSSDISDIEVFQIFNNNIWRDAINNYAIYVLYDRRYCVD